MKRKTLAVAVSLAVAAPGVAWGYGSTVCIGNNFEQGVPASGTEMPSVAIQEDPGFLGAGESVVLNVQHSIDPAGTADFYWCAEAGALEPVAADLSQVRYTAPAFAADPVVRVGVQIGDRLGYVSGDSIAVQTDALPGGTVSGQLLDSGGNPLSGITVSACGTSTQTDANGYFELTGLPEGSCTLEVDYPGFQSAGLDIDYSAGSIELGALQPTIPYPNPTIFVAKGQGNNTLRAYDTDGVFLKEYATDTSGGDLNIASVDFDGDGLPEAIGFIRGQGGTLVEIFGVNGDWTGTKTLDIEGNHFAAGDLDGDSISDFLIAPNSSNRTSVDEYLSTQGGGLSNAVEMFDKNTRMGPAIGDVDGDGAADYLAGDLSSSNGDRLSIRYAAGGEGAIEVFAAEQKSNYGVHVFTGDLDCDGTDEIGAAMASGGSKIELYEADGALIGSFDAFPDHKKGLVAGMGNVVGDDAPEIIVGQNDGDQVAIFDADGTLIKQFTGVDQGTISSIAVNRTGACASEVAPSGVNLESVIAGIDFKVEGKPLQPYLPEEDDDTTPPVDPPIEPDLDSDDDGLEDQDEFAIGTLPDNPDSDGDGIDDKTEVGDFVANPTRMSGEGPINALNPAVQTVKDQLGQWVSVKASNGKLKNLKNYPGITVGGIPYDSGIGELPHGVFKFNVEELAEGEAVTVTLEFDDLADGVSNYAKNGSEQGPGGNSGWYLHGGQIDGNRVSFTLVDNGKGDSDATPGRISDPGGPATGAAATAGEPISIPVLSAWSAGLLSLLAALAGFFGMRRGRRSI